MDKPTLIRLVIGLCVVALPVGYGIKMILTARRGLREMEDINRRLFGLSDTPSKSD